MKTTVIAIVAGLLLVVSTGCQTTAKGTPWTIMCTELNGPHAEQLVSDMADSLRRTPGIRPDEVHYLRGTDGSVCLYYGTYHRRANPETGKRTMPRQLVRDLELIKSLGSGDRQYFFRQAMIMRQPFPNVGNPAWDLADAVGRYTLQVAVFEPTDDVPNYKQAAAEYCAELRRQGLPAYYHHGSACSMVTVGLFGEHAILRRGGQPTYSAEVLALQRNPLCQYNLLNGSPYRPIVGGQALAPVPSQLVLLPGQEPEKGEWDATRR